MMKYEYFIRYTIVPSDARKSPSPRLLKTILGEPNRDTPIHAGMRVMTWEASSSEEAISKLQRLSLHGYHADLRVYEKEDKRWFGKRPLQRHER